MLDIGKKYSNAQPIEIIFVFLLVKQSRVRLIQNKLQQIIMVSKALFSTTFRLAEDCH